MDSARVGLDYIVESSDYIHKLASALESSNDGVKKQVFELLSALCVYSTQGYDRTIEALEKFKEKKGERYSLKFIVEELQRNDGSVPYLTAVLAFVNCLILATSDVQERVRIRSQFIGLNLIHVLSDLRDRYKSATDLMVQVDVFEEQKESDEGQVSVGNSKGIDLSSPLEVFDAIIGNLENTPQEVPFLTILQHLLRIDTKDPISDLIWDAAERLVHRATLIESAEDAVKLLSPKSHCKPVHKIKDGLNNNHSMSCCCSCHNRKNKEQPNNLLDTLDSVTTSNEVPNPPESRSMPPPPPPAPPANGLAPPPPPAPPANGLTPPPPPPPPGLSTPSPKKNSIGITNPQLDHPKLPQQTIPQPKSRMRTVNWNKIPSGQVLSGNPGNLWAKFAKNHSHRKMSLDWAALEGLFCIQNDSQKLPTMSTPNLTSNEAKDSSQKKSCLVKKESNEITLLDAKRSLNINIFLKQFKSSNQELIQLIKDGRTEDLGYERLRGLLKMLPTADEIDVLKSIPDSDKSRLATAETFLSELTEVPGYRLRVEAMVLKEELQTFVTSLHSSIDSIIQAVQGIKNSSEFQEVLFMVIVAGNFLNSGGYAGNAAGVKLSSLQKIVDIRGNKPGFNLIHFIAKEAELRDPALINFVDALSAVEEASKTSVATLKSDISQLKTKVYNICNQMEGQNAPSELREQLSDFFQEAKEELVNLDTEMEEVDKARKDFAAFFCEDEKTFQLEDSFKILNNFLTKWKLAAVENERRQKQEEEATARRKQREETMKLRLKNAIAGDSFGNPCKNNYNNMATLNPEDEIFIACSPRIVRRRLGSCEPQPNEMSPCDSYNILSPDVTPNGSLRRRRSRVLSDEDENTLMDYLRASGQSKNRERRPLPEQYGSLDRSWARKPRRRPNLLEFVNDDRERPVSPSTAGTGFNTDASAQKSAQDASQNDGNGNNEIATKRDWKERISAWFVDLENKTDSKKQRQRLAPPRRYQRLKDIDGTPSSLETLPETEPAEGMLSPKNTTQEIKDVNAVGYTADSKLPKLIEPVLYQRVYPDKKPSLHVKTDVLGAMEAIEEVQSPHKDKKGPIWTRPSNSNVKRNGSNTTKTDDRRTFIESLGSRNHEDKLVLYIQEKPTKQTDSNISRSSSLREKRTGKGSWDPNLSFDRFASMRKSKRYKSGTPSDLTSSHFVDLGKNCNRTGNVDESGKRVVEPSNTSSERSVRQFRSRKDLKGNNCSESRHAAQTAPYLKNLSKPSTEHPKTQAGERDEGFEESVSLLSEIDTNLAGAAQDLQKSLKGSENNHNTRKRTVTYEASKSINGTSKAVKAVSKSEPNMVSSKSPIRKNSSFVKETNSNNDINLVNSDTGTKDHRRTAVTANDAVTNNTVLKGGLVGSGPTKNGSSRKQDAFMIGGSKGRSSLGPKIFSFMRPTASSSAKDRVEKSKQKLEIAGIHKSLSTNGSIDTTSISKSQNIKKSKSLFESNNKPLVRKYSFR